MIRPRRIADRLRLSSSALPGGKGERHSSWLETFFDLVFVLALFSVGNRLQNVPDPTVIRVLAAGGLFAVVWQAWVGQAFYDTRFDPDDLPHRLGVLVAMAGAGAMAAGVTSAPRTLLLPIGYLMVRGVLLMLYLRVRRTSRATEQLTTVYLVGFGTGWLVWLGSLAAPPEVRPAVWISAMTIELLAPWLGRRWLIRLPVHPTHLPERIGLFTIILLGVTLTDLLDAVPARPSGRTIAAAALAFVLPAAIWWVYSTFVTTGLALPRLSAGLSYGYVHVVLGAALLLIGWSLGQVVRQVSAGSTHLPVTLRMLLGTAIVAWVICGLALQWVSLGFLVGRRIVIAVLSVLVIAALVITATEPMTLLALLAATLVGYAVAVTRNIVLLGARFGA